VPLAYLFLPSVPSQLNPREMKTTALHVWRRDMSLETVLVAIRRCVSSSPPRRAVRPSLTRSSFALCAGRWLSLPTERLLSRRKEANSLLSRLFLSPASPSPLSPRIVRRPSLLLSFPHSISLDVITFLLKATASLNERKRARFNPIRSPFAG
jgi:hypothetical protein